MWRFIIFLSFADHRKNRKINIFLDEKNWKTFWCRKSSHHKKYGYSFVFFKCRFYYVLVVLFFAEQPPHTFRSLARPRCVLRISSLHFWNLLMILLRFKKKFMENYQKFLIENRFQNFDQKIFENFEKSKFSLDFH